MTSYEHIIVETSGHVITITINRPAVLNALHPPAHAEMARALDAFAADDDLWLAVITGAGERAFCTGSDLKERVRLGKDDMPATGFAGITERFDLFKPVIARINGHCVGGGLEIALACDLAIAADHAKFGLPETTIGLAAAGGLHRLFRQLPQKTAMKLALTGTLISATEAAEANLINAAVPADDLDKATDSLIAQLLDCAPLALQATKQMALKGLDANALADAFRAVYPAEERMLASDDAVEGPRAFTEKRKPRWTGR